MTERLRAGRRVGRTLTLRFRADDFTRQTRSRTLPQATDRTDEFLAAGRELLAARWPELRATGCTLLGVTVSDLCPADAVQLSLPLDGHDRRALDHVLDDVHARFGHVRSCGPRCSAATMAVRSRSSPTRRNDAGRMVP